MAQDHFITVPQVTLPSGIVVPSFVVGQYLCTPGAPHESGVTCCEIGDRIARAAAVSADTKPWVHINYADARAACAAAGYALITELQALALAWDACQQDINWTGGAVGQGSMFQGLHADSVDCAQPGTYDPARAHERRWMQLSNGERIYDLAGNAFSWIFDDVQGDENGLIAKAFAEDSPSIMTAPYPSESHGMGWRPDAGRDWSGRALVRGGYWGSGVVAGVFRLVDVWPVSRYVVVGFRCTKPGL